MQGERNQDLLLSWLSRQKHKSLVRWIDLLCNCSVHFKMLFLCWSSLAGQMISFFFAAVIYFLRQCQHLMKFTKRKIMMASFYWICSMVHKTGTALQTFTDKLYYFVSIIVSFLSVKNFTYCEWPFFSCSRVRRTSACEPNFEISSGLLCK